MSLGSVHGNYADGEIIRIDPSVALGNPMVVNDAGTLAKPTSIIVDRNDAAAVWRNLAAAIDRCDGRPAGDEAAEIWRVMRGLPASGHELT